MGRTRGIAAPGHTVETLAARFDEIMAPDGAETVGIASLDTAQWKLKPYRGTGS